MAILKTLLNADAKFLFPWLLAVSLQCRRLPACSKHEEYSPHMRNFFILHGTNNIRRVGKTHKDVVIASLDHPHYTQQQEEKCKHVIHPCKEIQPFPEPEGSHSELERYSYFLTVNWWQDSYSQAISYEMQIKMSAALAQPYLEQEATFSSTALFQSRQSPAGCVEHGW